LRSKVSCSRGQDVDQETTTSPFRVYWSEKAAPGLPKHRAVTFPLRVEPSYNLRKCDPCTFQKEVTQFRYRSKSEPFFITKQYRLSELIPDCRLKNIEARGGDRDFSKWFMRLPPNVKLDKDVKTDHGVLRKDNFPTSRALDKYLGIQKSKSIVARKYKC